MPIGNPADIPTGTVTLLLGDVERSVRGWETDREAMSAAVRRLNEIVDAAVATHNGARPVEQGEGDSFVLAFARASDAVACALDLQLGISKESWPRGLDLRVRMGAHTGDAQLRDEGNYAGPAINRCARIRSLGHGGQTLLSRATYELVVDSLPDGAFLVDVGEHRLRDLARPERIYQLSHPDLASDFPSLLSLSSLPNNLPLQLTSFVGREGEMQQIRRLLRDTRLLTLTGAGGCGKTRLALQVAAEVIEDFPDGVFWVDLAPVGDAALVGSVVAAVLGVQEVPNERVRDTIVRFVRERRILLVLDNCEHLVAACAELAATLLRNCPAVSIVGTSREPLGLDGETAFRVPSLPFPESNPTSAVELVPYPSTHLFVDRALRARPNFELTDQNAPAIAAICRCLDGIPLAIELAAARTRVLSPAQIAEGLIDRFQLLTGGARTTLPRQRTLEASVDWSYRMLSEEERTLLTGLSIFAGSFDLDAAENVCAGDTLDQYRVLDVLTALVDRSLVQAEDAPANVRYRLLETIRIYARNKLAETDEGAAIRTRHLDYFVALAERAEPEMRGAGFGVWAERLTIELDNLRAAMEWALASDQPDKHLRLTGSLLSFWVVRSLFSEIRRSMEAALAATAVDPVLRAKALGTASLITLMAGNYAASRPLAAESVALAESTGGRDLTQGLTYLAWSEFLLGEGDEKPRERLDRALRMAREEGDSLSLMRPLIYRAFLESQSRGTAAASPFWEESIRLAEEAGDHYFLSVSRAWFGIEMIMAGRFEEAGRALSSAANSARLLESMTFTTLSLSMLGWLALLRGEHDTAGALLDEAAAALPEGAIQPGYWVAAQRGVLLWATDRLDAAIAVLDGAMTLGREIGNVSSSLFAIAARGAAAIEAGDFQTARSCLEDAVESSRRGSFAYFLGQSLLYLGRLERAEGHDERAEALVHEALQRMVTFCDRATPCDALETIAGLATAQGSHREAARLFGAAQRLRDEIGYVRFPVNQPTYDADVAIAREALGDAFASAWDEGQAMPFEEAVAYAERGRGERKRPASGWASLTPAEHQVVRLAAEGLTNPQIAEKLFITRNTVKVHLQHVFAKLGVTTRSELAAVATKRGLLS
jgi:predicted ATPase/class 3 adenylate cyclase/DNA-binding CsgD family transcriptional regulator